jgi:hypothetical protein
MSYGMFPYRIMSTAGVYMKINSPLSFLLLPLRTDSFKVSLAAERTNFLRIVLFALGSAVCTVVSVFIVGGSVYHIFFEQYTSFILERLTGFSLLGNTISRYDYWAVFYTGIIFWMKFILFFLFLFAVLLRIFAKGGIGIGTSIAIGMSAAASFGPVLLILSVLTRFAGLLVPAYTSWIYYLALAAVFIIFLPVTIQQLIDNIEDTGINSFRLYISYYGAVFIIILLWSYNHYNLFLLRML